WWMRQHARALRGEVEQRVEAAEASRRLWAVGLIAFAGVFREGAETVLFLWGLMTQVGSTHGWDSAIGAALGLVVAAALGWVVYLVVGAALFFGSGALAPWGRIPVAARD